MENNKTKKKQEFNSIIRNLSAKSLTVNQRQAVLNQLDQMLIQQQIWEIHNQPLENWLSILLIPLFQSTVKELHVRIQAIMGKIAALDVYRSVVWICNEIAAMGEVSPVLLLEIIPNMLDQMEDSVAVHDYLGAHLMVVLQAAQDEFVVESVLRCFLKMNSFGSTWLTSISVVEMVNVVLEWMNNYTLEIQVRTAIYDLLFALKYWWGENRVYRLQLLEMFQMEIQRYCSGKMNNDTRVQMNNAVVSFVAIAQISKFDMLDGIPLLENVLKMVLRLEENPMTIQNKIRIVNVWTIEANAFPTVFGTVFHLMTVFILHMQRKRDQDESISDRRRLLCQMLNIMNCCENSLHSSHLMQLLAPTNKWHQEMVVRLLTIRDALHLRTLVNFYTNLVQWTNISGALAALQYIAKREKEKSLVGIERTFLQLCLQKSQPWDVSRHSKEPLEKITSILVRLAQSIAIENAASFFSIVDGLLSQVQKLENQMEIKITTQCYESLLEIFDLILSQLTSKRIPIANTLTQALKSTSVCISRISNYTAHLCEPSFQKVVYNIVNSCLSVQSSWNSDIRWHSFDVLLNCIRYFDMYLDSHDIILANIENCAISGASDNDLNIRQVCEKIIARVAFCMNCPRNSGCSSMYAPHRIKRILLTNCIRNRPSMFSILPWLLKTKQSVTMDSKLLRDQVFMGDDTSFLSNSILSNTGLASVCYHSCNLVWLWCIWDSAMACVRDKLKSDFGGPMRTFQAVECALQFELNVLEGKDYINSTTTSLPSYYLVLEFLEALERGVAVAYNGDNMFEKCYAKTNTYCTNKANGYEVRTFSTSCSSFFHTNKQVCDDWFLRLRSVAFQLCAKVGSLHYTIRAGEILLANLEKNIGCKTFNVNSWYKQLDTTLFHICVLLCDCKDPLSIQGYESWSSNLLSSLSKAGHISPYSFAPLEILTLNEELKIPWTKALYYESAGQLEEALREYCTMFDGILETGNPSAIFTIGSMTSTNLCVQRIVNCCIALDDKVELNRWLVAFEKLRGISGKFDDTIELYFPRVSRSTMQALVLMNRYTDHENSHRTKEFCDSLSYIEAVKNAKDNVLHSPNALLAVRSIEFELIETYHQELATLFPSEIGNRNFPQSCSNYLTPAFVKNHDNVGSWTRELGEFSFKRRVPLMYIVCILQLARKQHNFQLCRRLLNYLKCIPSESKPLHKILIAKEESQLMFASNTKEEAISFLWQQICDDKVDHYESCTASPDLLSIKADMHCKFAKWLEHYEVDDKSIQLGDVRHLLTHAGELGNAKINVIHDSLQIASSISPLSATIWLRLGNWSHQQGLIALRSSNLHCLDLEEEMELRKIVQIAVGMEIVKLDDVQSELNTLRNLLLHSLNSMCKDEAAFMKSTKNMCTWLNTFDQGCNLLSKLFRTCWNRVMRWHALATSSYFKYLRLASMSDSRKKDGNLTIVTLRILCNLVKFTTSLKVEMDAGFVKTPTLPWLNIVPQLLSRLGHPHVYVQVTLQRLLLRLCDDNPIKMVFPLLVNSGVLRENTQILEGNPFDNLLCALSSRSKSLVDEAKCLAIELLRISALWEDVWIQSLTAIGKLVQKNSKKLSLKTMGDEHDENSQYSCAVVRGVLKSLDQAIEKLWNSTIGKYKDGTFSETPYECAFVDNYKNKIICARTEMLCYSGNSISEAWKPMDNLLHSLLLRSSKDQYMLHEISPVLEKFGSLTHTLCIPGESGSIRISGFGKYVTLFASKTKPKLITFIAHDGTSHPYILKGNEDLHLDERIMQLLQNVNSLLSNKKLNHADDLYARHYHVLPLSRKAGIIKMVPNVASLFDLYKKGSTVPLKFSEGEEKQQGPADEFYEVIKPMLRASGHTLTSPRAQWPFQVLKKAYLTLLDRSPCNILDSLMWINSSGSSDWWKRKCTYSTSLAVMSVIGFIIGLGDRHLDNILISLNTGEVVHIDYNVCFEKGKTLRVPEIVPFRLTKFLTSALGVVNVNGRFRSAFERTLQALRTHEETILTLLEAFVYDPLIDWRSDECQSDHNEKYLEISMSFAILDAKLEVYLPLAENCFHCINTVLDDFSNEVCKAMECYASCRMHSISLLHIHNLNVMDADVSRKCWGYSKAQEAISSVDKTCNRFQRDASPLHRDMTLAATNFLIPWKDISSGKFSRILSSCQSAIHNILNQETTKSTLDGHQMLKQLHIILPTGVQIFDEIEVLLDFFSNTFTSPFFEDHHGAISEIICALEPRFALCALQVNKLLTFDTPKTGMDLLGTINGLRLVCQILEDESITEPNNSNALAIHADASSYFKHFASNVDHDLLLREKCLMANAKYKTFMEQESMVVFKRYRLSNSQIHKFFMGGAAMWSAMRLSAITHIEYRSPGINFIDNNDSEPKTNQHLIYSIVAALQVSSYSKREFLNFSVETILQNRQNECEQLVQYVRNLDSVFELLHTKFATIFYPTSNVHASLIVEDLRNDIAAYQVVSTNQADSASYFPRYRSKWVLLTMPNAFLDVVFNELFSVLNLPGCKRCTTICSSTTENLGLLQFGLAQLQLSVLEKCTTGLNMDNVNVVESHVFKELTDFASSILTQMYLPCLRHQVIDYCYEKCQIQPGDNTLISHMDVFKAELDAALPVANRLSTTENCAQESMYKYFDGLELHHSRCLELSNVVKFIPSWKKFMNMHSRQLNEVRKACLWVFPKNTIENAECEKPRLSMFDWVKQIIDCNAKLKRFCAKLDGIVVAQRPAFTSDTASSDGSMQNSMSLLELCRSLNIILDMLIETVASGCSWTHGITTLYECQVPVRQRVIVLAKKLLNNLRELEVSMNEAHAAARQLQVFRSEGSGQQQASTVNWNTERKALQSELRFLECIETNIKLYRGTAMDMINKNRSKKQNPHAWTTLLSTMHSVKKCAGSVDLPESDCTIYALVKAAADDYISCAQKVQDVINNINDVPELVGAALVFDERSKGSGVSDTELQCVEALSLRLSRNLAAKTKVISNVGHVKKLLESMQQALSKVQIYTSKIRRGENISASPNFVTESLSSLNTQDRNAHALNILKQVQQKLQGRNELPLDSVQPLSVKDHAEKLISEATDENNLCRMYEGWTPWV